MVKNKRSAEKEAFWRKVLQQYQKSGLSIREFCRRKGITEPSLYAWRKEIRKRDAERDVTNEHVHARGRQTLIPVEIVDADGSRLIHGQPSSPPLELLTPNGFTLRFPQHIDPRQLGHLVSAITGDSSGGISSC
jgi:transposase-like protein